MERKVLKSFACAAAIVLALSVTACGGSNDPAHDTDVAAAEDTAGAKEETAEAGEVNDDEAETEAKVKTETEDETEDEADAEAEVGAENEWETLADFFSDPAIKAQAEESYAAFAPQGTSVTVDTVGNKLMINFKFVDGSFYGQLGKSALETLEESLDLYADQFETAAAQFDEAFGEEGASVITVRYLDPEDNVLAEKTYKAP